VTVGLETGATYEAEHHRNAALAAGVRREQLDHLPEFETADCFTDQERAVIRLAKEVTVGGRASAATWEALAFLGERQRLELVLTIAWYNCVVRIILPLQIDIEPWFVRQ
jgi:alkylhydroperoxidase family enzyme